jgi:hypothetical protein
MLAFALASILRCPEIEGLGREERNLHPRDLGQTQQRMKHSR